MNWRKCSDILLSFTNSSISIISVWILKVYTLSDSVLIFTVVKGFQQCLAETYSLNNQYSDWQFVRTHIFLQKIIFSMFFGIVYKIFRNDRRYDCFSHAFFCPKHFVLLWDSNIEIDIRFILFSCMCYRDCDVKYKNHNRFYLMSLKGPYKRLKYHIDITRNPENLFNWIVMLLLCATH